MRALGTILAIIGIIVIVLGVVRHFSAYILPSTAHASIILAVVGVVVLVIGAGLAMTGRRA